MAECNSHETHNIYPNLGVSLSDQQHFRLNKINEIKDYFVAEIKERELMSKRLSKYIAPFEYFYNSLIILSITTGSISIASFATVIGAPVGIVDASFSLAFSISTGTIKKLLKTTRNKNKKRIKIVTLARNKLNSIENKVSEALINHEISHEDFMTIIMGKKDQEPKENIRMMNSQKLIMKTLTKLKKAKKIGINKVMKHNKIINNS